MAAVQVNLAPLPSSFSHKAPIPIDPILQLRPLTNTTPQIASPTEYRTARVALLEKEKHLTRARDALAAERRALPLVEVTKPYTFTTLDAFGHETATTLVDLFGPHRQLIIYHFMFSPDWDAGCSSCSLCADHFPPLEHLASRDTAFACVSRAPIAKIAAYKKRMGWSFPWVSSYNGDFNYDFHVTQDPAIAPIDYNFETADKLKAKGLDYFMTGEQPGHSCFVKGGNGVGEEGKVYHTYSTYARGGEPQIGTYGWLDMTFLGRQDPDKRKGLGFCRRDEYEH
jgi:predicted dithiol-disulfide oxidoreductase (DUF899 family)